MLSLQLKSGEYLTIGDDIAIQIFQQSGSAFSVAIKAPREIPILRGAVAERSGEQRPDDLRDRRSKTPSEKKWDAKRLAVVEEKQVRERTARENKAAALQGMQESLERLEMMLSKDGYPEPGERNETQRVVSDSSKSSDALSVNAAMQKEIRLLRMQMKRILATETISAGAKIPASAPADTTGNPGASGMRKAAGPAAKPDLSAIAK